MTGGRKLDEYVTKHFTRVGEKDLPDEQVENGIQLLTPDTAVESCKLRSTQHPRPRCRRSGHRPFSHSTPTHPLSSTSQQVLIKDKKFIWYFSYPSPTSPFRASLIKKPSNANPASKDPTSRNHTDRPLFEIKLKCRPVSQCDKCRELRKTRRVYSKHLCSKFKVEDCNKQGSTLSSGSGP